MRLILVLFTLAGPACSARLMDKRAMDADRRADKLAQVGKPDKAQAARDHADSLYLRAQLHSEAATRQHFGWIGW